MWLSPIKSFEDGILKVPTQEGESKGIIRVGKRSEEMPSPERKEAKR